MLAQYQRVFIQLHLNQRFFDKKCQMLCLKYPYTSQVNNTEVTTLFSLQELYNLPRHEVSESGNTRFCLLEQL